MPIVALTPTTSLAPQYGYFYIDLKPYIPASLVSAYVPSAIANSTFDGVKG